MNKREENKKKFDKLFCKEHFVVTDHTISWNFHKCKHCGIEMGELMRMEREALRKSQNVS